MNAQEMVYWKAKWATSLALAIQRNIQTVWPAHGSLKFLKIILLNLHLTILNWRTVSYHQYARVIMLKSKTVRIRVRLSWTSFVETTNHRRWYLPGGICGWSLRLTQEQIEKDSTRLIKQSVSFGEGYPQRWKSCISSVFENLWLNTIPKFC